MKSLGIVGGGAWGTALAASSIRAGRDVLMWALEHEVVDSINTTHQNALYLPDIDLDPAIKATDRLGDLDAADIILLVCPAQHLRAVSADLAPLIRPATPLVICAKGIEIETLSLMSEVLAETAPQNPVAVLSGPTFAAEVARNLPSAVTLACADPALGGQMVQALGHSHFRPYGSDDVIGAQIGGAVKNVLAIAAGIVAGAKLGDNAAAALITRGLAEIMRLGDAKGANRQTLMGLSGLGDLLLTCGSTQSRNMSLGKALGEGRSLEEIMAERRSVAEGVHTAAAVARLADALAIDMPICAAMNRILHHGGVVNDEIDALLNRPFTTELE